MLIYILRKKYGMTVLALFGSVARGEHNDNSNVDVFVSMPTMFYQACATNLKNKDNPLLYYNDLR